MKKNKAFTLIELIAVIVILGIIAIITTSSILIILKNNRKNTFALSLENLIKSFELLNSNSSITGEYYDNIAVTSPILETSNEKFKDGELGYNSHRIPEVRYATNGEFCGAGTSGKFQVSSGNCEGLDISPAVIANITTIPSQYSIRIIITANDRESGVAKYEISTDSAIYIETGTEYLLNGLDAATEYDIYVRVTNGKDLITVQKVTVSTLDLEMPNIIVNPIGWAQSKQITIEYPEGDYEYSYNLNGSGWIESEPKTVVLNMIKNGFIIARVADKKVYKQSATINIDKIDIDTPTCEIVVTNENNWTTSKQLTIEGYDYYSGVSGIQNPGDLEYTNNSTTTMTVTTIGTYNANVKDNVGRIGTCSIEVNKVDSTAPTSASVAVSEITTKSIRVEASGVDLQSGITKYEFSIDGGSYINNGNNRSYLFANLLSGNHAIKVRVTNAAGMTRESSILNTSTDIPDTPTFSVNTSNWVQSKVVTITYPPLEEDFVYQYNQNNTGWITITGGDVTKQLTFSSNGYVIARIFDGLNYFTSSTYNVTKVDSVSPIISDVYSGGMVYKDPTFASGSNSIYVYNNTGNGLVGHTRQSMSTPAGSYALEIKTTGAASPGHGGFYFATGTSANQVLVTKIIAKIPVGYTINFASNAYGNEGTSTWLSSQAGTGNWETYIHVAKCGSTGSFSSTNFFYLLGGSTPTVSSPLTWYVGYATVITNSTWETTNNISFKATDGGSGITQYGVNQSSSTPPSTWTSMTASNSFGNMITGITSNGTYYVWVKDQAGNTQKVAIAVSKIDTQNPTCSITQSDSASWTTSKYLTITSSDDGGVTHYKKPGDSSYTAGTSGGLTVYSNGTYTATVLDIAGKTGTCSVAVSLIDTAAPSCSMSVDNAGSWATSKWVSISGSDSGSDSQSGVYGFILPGNSSYTAGTSSGFTAYNTTTYTTTVKDNAGRTNTCSVATQYIGNINYGDKQAYNNSGGYLKLGTDSVFNLNQNTFHFYARVAKDSAGDRRIAIFGDSSVGWEITWLADGRIRWTTRYGGSSYHTYSSNYLPATGTFYDVQIDFNSTGTGAGDLYWNGTWTSANRSARHQYSNLTLTLGTLGIYWRNYIRVQGRDYAGNQPDRYGYINNLSVSSSNQTTGSLSTVNTTVTQDTWWTQK